MMNVGPKTPQRTKQVPCYISCGSNQLQRLKQACFLKSHSLGAFGFAFSRFIPLNGLPVVKIHLEMRFVLPFLRHNDFLFQTNAWSTFSATGCGRYDHFLVLDGPVHHSDSSENRPPSHTIAHLCVTTAAMALLLLMGVFRGGEAPRFCHETIND